MMLMTSQQGSQGTSMSNERIINSWYARDNCSFGCTPMRDCLHNAPLLTRLLHKWISHWPARVLSIPLLAAGQQQLQAPKLCRSFPISVSCPMPIPPLSRSALPSPASASAAAAAEPSALPAQPSTSVALGWLACLRLT